MPKDVLKTFQIGYAAGVFDTVETLALGTAISPKINS